MANKSDDRNRFQISRMDNRGCFVEAKSDWFSRDQLHFEFATYDMKRPEGERYTNHINIYIEGPVFLDLATDIVGGQMLMEIRYPTKPLEEPLFDHPRGTSAEKLASYGTPRKDGMSQSRVMKILRGNKRDSVLLIADSGPGEANKTGIIVPRFGNKPENHVVISLNYSQLKQLFAPAHVQYAAYVNAMTFKRAMDGEFASALDFMERPQPAYPNVVNFNG